jgi:hypothetical protein
MLWQKCKAVGCRPSELIGLPSNSYSAYCLDEAVIYFGMMLENMLEEAGTKPSKADRKAQRSRERILNKVLGTGQADTGYADPALMFK